MAEVQPISNHDNMIQSLIWIAVVLLFNSYTNDSVLLKWSILDQIYPKFNTQACIYSINIY